MNLEEIKKQLNVLASQVDALSKPKLEEDDGMYHLTQAEMIKFVKNFIEDCENRVEECVKNTCFDSDIVDLSLEGNEIQIDIDSSQIHDEIMSELDFDYSEDELLDSIHIYYRNAKKF